jgi:hypothetical protein
MISRRGDRSLESELRRVLGARAAQAPMPSDLLDVPDRSLRSSHASTWLAVLRVVTVAAAAVLLVVLGAQALRLGELREQLGASLVTVGQVATHVGVPPRQVVVTRDGAIALQLREGGTEAHVYLVTRRSDGDGLESRLLGWADVHPGVLAEGSSLTWYEHLSCESTSGLHQPNIVFGATGDGIRAETVSVPATGTTNGRLFLIVLNEGQSAGESVYLTAEQADAGAGPGISFDRGDACAGEHIEHLLLP